MAESHATLSAQLGAWWMEQPLFFVATAPSEPGGSINLSPKGLDTLRVLSSSHVAYLDLTGSGVETIAHLRDNSAITLMTCAFSGTPRISRIYGRGVAHLAGSKEFGELRGHFGDLPGARSIISIAISRVTTSCGFAVPLMDLVSDRDRLTEWSRAKGPDGIVQYWHDRNATSLDGLPAIDPT
jgi:hypothetical protein